MTTQVYDARDFASAWLAVSQAASDDKDHKLMWRAIHLQVWLDVGIRLSATDQRVAMTAWVPVYDTLERQPDTDPDVACIAIDQDRRAKASMLYAMRTTKPQVADEWMGQEAELVLDLNADNPDDDGQVTIPDEALQQRWVAYELPGREMVVCSTLQAPFPDVRRMVANAGQLAPTDRVSVNAIRLGSFVQAERWHVGCPLVMEFRGSPTQVVARLEGSDPRIEGVLAPVRDTAGEAAPPPHPDQITIDAGDDGGFFDAAIEGKVSEWADHAHAVLDDEDGAS